MSTVPKLGASPGLKPVRRGRAGVRTPWLFAAPAVVFYSLFFGFSVLFSLMVALKRWNMLTPPLQSKWVGLTNFTYILTEDPLFFRVLYTTLLFAVGTVVFTLVIGLVVAFAMTRVPFKAFWRTIYFLPMVTTVVAVANIWKFIYDPNFGLLNAGLRAVGVPPGRWLESPETALASLIAVSVWSSLGGAILILSAGLEGIPEDYYEAARIDGANILHEFRYITIPMLLPTIVFVVITGFMAGLQSFALALIMTNGGPADATRVLALYMYETAFQNLRVGRATAMVFVLFVVIFLITVLQLRVFKRGGVENY